MAGCVFSRQFGQHPIANIEWEGLMYKAAASRHVQLPVLSCYLYSTVGAYFLWRDEEDIYLFLTPSYVPLKRFL